MRHDPDKYLRRQTKQIQELLEQATEDRRLREAQRYLGLVDIFGIDPLLLAAQRLKRAMDHRSKINLPEEVILRLLVMMRDRVVPMPDPKTRKRGRTRISSSSVSSGRPRHSSRARCPSGTGTRPHKDACIVTCAIRTKPTASIRSVCCNAYLGLRACFRLANQRLEDERWLRPSREAAPAGPSGTG